ncbi:hypothetical protein HPB51_028223 [Rhipicephalus microplus]|uniref:Sulfotransferase domain-containing protein n=1 Tax=Rhipicephalus microplus TaxID=6941 RepID=A0A9J6CY30_RHIMP|nr:hypothetical protein HPB51_028223 [Rhipicephalus microplus]
MILRSPYYQVIDGVRRSAIVQPDVLRKALHFTPVKGDILQMSYPKCGTHWMQYLTLLILNEGRPIRNYQEFSSSGRSVEYAGIEGWKPHNGERTLPYRAMLTHLDPPRKKHLNADAKYVYVARNPWDCCVSFYHHVSNLSPFRFQDGTFDEFLDSFLRGDFGYGDYFDHVLAGYALKDEPNVLFVTYEQIKEDTRSVGLKLAYFLDERYGRALETNDCLLRTLMERSTVEHMKKLLVLDLKGEENPAMSGLFKGREVYAKVGYQGDRSKYSFVRKGIVGGWSEHFTKWQLQKMNVRITERTKGSDVMCLWTNIVRETKNAMRGEQ